MEEYKKVVYVWNEPNAKLVVPTRLQFRPVDEDSIDILIDAVGQSMIGSLDRSDKKMLAENPPNVAAKNFVDEAAEYFNYDLSWWQLAYDQNDELVGFVQPVVFPDCQKDGLEEATIYYIGVLPEQRGHGYGYDLLCQCTRALQEVGVWRIYCDTDVYNASMIKTFERAGYVQEGEPKVVEL
ncbi:MAG: GNAT family N-acetyltransferase [Chloroflexota bacterium]